VQSITYNNPTNVTFTVNVAPSALAGARSITIINPDGQSSSSASGILTIQSGATNSPPSLSAISNQVVNEQTLLSFTAGAVDPDGNGLTYSLDPGAPTGASINAASGVFTWIPSEAQGPSTNNITIRVTDNGVPPMSDAKTFNVIVAEVNQAPQLAVIPDKVVTEEQTLTFWVSASDADLPANGLSFSLQPGAPLGVTIGASSGVFTWTPTEAQGPSTNKITVRVTDNGVPSLSATQSFTVVVLESNRAPVIALVTNQVVTEEQMLEFSITATDADLPKNFLLFTLEANAPEGASINPTNGLFSWQPSEAQGPSTNQITVRVTDNGIPPLSATQSFAVVVLESNRPPVLLAISDQSLFAGETLSLLMQASDPDLPTNQLTFTFLNAPAGATIETNSGAFNWSPTDLQANSTNSITIVVQDDGVPTLSATQTFNVIVLESNHPPVLSPIVDQVVYPGELVEVTFFATDLDLTFHELSFAISNAPPGALFDPVTRQLSWTPSVLDANTTNLVTVKVQDNGVPPLSDAKGFQIIVAPLPVVMIETTNGLAKLTWPSVPGKLYDVEYKLDALSTNWVALTNAIQTITNLSIQTDSVDTNGTKLYRVKVNP
jgi:hypothetical protein